MGRIVDDLKEGHAGLQEQLHGLRRDFEVRVEHVRSEVEEVNRDLVIHITEQRNQHSENGRRLERMEKAMDGNGRDGLLTSVGKLMTMAEAAADEAHEQQAVITSVKESVDKMKGMGLLFGVSVTVVLAVVEVVMHLIMGR